MRDINISPCRWHVRIWDVDNNEWLCEHDDDALPYYGFDIRGGEVTAIQGMRGVYNAFAHGKEFIWEQSTGLKDRHGTEIYESDVVLDYYDGDDAFIVKWDEDTASFILTGTDNIAAVSFDNFDPDIDLEVIGNIHENPELLDDSIHGPYGPIGEENIGGESRRMKNENLGKN